MSHHVFISYAHEDVHVAEAIQQTLVRNGYDCWRDDSLRGGQKWPLVLKDRIAETYGLLVVASAAAAKSRWVTQEIEWAEEYGKVIFPVKLGPSVPTKLRGKLGKRQFITCPGGEVTPNAERQLVLALNSAGLGMNHDPVDEALDWTLLDRSFGHLRAGDRDRLNEIADLARRRYRATPGRPVWTVHGLRHANGVLAMLADMLHDRYREDPHEVFCLVAAACLHDIGLVTDVTPGCTDPTRRCRAASGGAMAARKLNARRLQHASRSAEWISANLAQLRLTRMEADGVRELARHHNPTHSIRSLAGNPELARLAATFRIANICDTGPQRAPAAIWELRYPDILADDQASFWLMNLMTSAVVVDRDERAIVIQARYPHEAMRFVPEQLKNEVKRRVSDVAAFLGQWRVEFGGDPDGDLVLNAQPDEVALCGLRYLSEPGATLVSSSDLVDYFTSAVQALSNDLESAEDATLRRRLNRITTMCDELVRRRPELHALRALQEAVKQAQPRRARPRCKLAGVGEAISAIQRRRSFCPLSCGGAEGTGLGELARNAFRCLGEPAGEALRFLVFGRSGPVTCFLQLCALADCPVTIYTPVMRPVGEGAELQVVNAFPDGNKGVTVELVPDAAIPRVFDTMSSGADGPRPKVLMGCEAVFAQRHQKRASIGTSLGARAIAQLAHAADPSVGVWVLTDSTKFVVDRAVSPWCQGNAAAGETPVAQFMFEPRAAEAAEASERTYPRSEVVPADLIELIITEDGAFTPRQAYRWLRVP